VVVKTVGRVQDADMVALAAEALMISNPWNYTDIPQNKLSPLGEKALKLINRAIFLDPFHLLAHHLRIHLLETQPIITSSQGDDANVTAGVLLQQALQSAKALQTLAMGVNIQHMTGHLLHMPAHAFARVGHWQAALQV
jgi:hypothetical protein